MSAVFHNKSRLIWTDVNIFVGPPPGCSMGLPGALFGPRTCVLQCDATEME